MTIDEALAECRKSGSLPQAEQNFIELMDSDQFIALFLSFWDKRNDMTKELVESFPFGPEAGRAWMCAMSMAPVLIDAGRRMERAKRNPDAG